MLSESCWCRFNNIQHTTCNMAIMQHFRHKQGTSTHAHRRLLLATLRTAPRTRFSTAISLKPPLLRSVALRNRHQQINICRAALSTLSKTRHGTATWLTTSSSADTATGMFTGLLLNASSMSCIIQVRALAPVVHARHCMGACTYARCMITHQGLIIRRLTHAGNSAMVF